MKSVKFLTTNGDAAEATLADGSVRSVAVFESTSGNFRLASRLRDFGVPYAYACAPV